MLKSGLGRPRGGSSVDFGVIVVFLPAGLNVEIGDRYDVIR